MPENLGVIFIALLVFLAVSACLLWAADRGAGIRTWTNASRIDAAFGGVFVATLIGVFGIGLRGLAENPQESTWSSDLRLPLIVAFVDAVWILVTCGLGRRVLLPAVSAALGVGILLWYAHA